jgi:DNA polymerase-3 subunit gamma/tau
MAYIVLARKYRPQVFEAVIGQEHVTLTLQNAVRSGRVAHAILLSGPRGTGKTTIARIIAKAMNCKDGPTPFPCNSCPSCLEITDGRSADVFEIDGASNNSVDQVRELRENSRYVPVSGRFKIYIIDEVHMLSTAAFNALLKILEEPPVHVMFLFATTEPHKVPITIHSRCQRYDMRRVPLASLVDHMKSLCESEGIDIPAESLMLIGKEAGGSVRDALSLLDQVMTGSEGPITHDHVVEIIGAVDRQVVIEMGDALMDGRLSILLGHLHSLHNRGHDLRKLFGDLLSHFRNLLIIKLDGGGDLVDLPPDERQMLEDRLSDRSAASIHQVFDLLFKEDATIRRSAYPKLAFELVLIRLCRMRPVLSIDELIEKVDQLQSSLFDSRAVTPESEASPDTGAVAKNPLPPVPSDATGVSSDNDMPPETAAACRPAYLAAGPQTPEQLWTRACECLAEKYPALAPNLRTASILSIENGRLEIEIEATPYILGRIKRRENLEAITDACITQFGKSLELVIHGKSKSEESSAQKKKQERKRLGEALSQPMVVETIGLFDGKVVDVKVFGPPET